MGRIKYSKRRGTRQALGALWQELVRRGIVYALVCKEEEDMVFGGLKITEWRREKKVRKRRAAS